MPTLHRAAIQLVSCIFVLVMWSTMVRGDDFWYKDWRWLKKAHSDVYRPLIPCEPTLFPTDCFDYFKPGCRCHKLSAPPVDSGVNATCSRPIFHPSHFASYWEEAQPTCRRPIFHEPHWQCHRESH